MKKMNLKKTAAILTLITCLAACGGAGNSSAPEAARQENFTTASYETYDGTASDEYYMESEGIALAPRSGGDDVKYTSPAAAPEEAMEDAVEYDAQFTSGGGDAGTPPETPQGSDIPPETPTDTDGNGAVKTRKLITTVSIDTETEQLDTVLNRIQSDVSAMGGYIESSHISQDRTYTGNNQYTTRRRATMTLRVPEKDLDGLLETLAGSTNVLEESRTTEDITLTYVDIESRKKSLETQRGSLMRLLEQAETVEDIITIEDRLSYVNYEIERMGSQLRSYDNLVDYATVHLTVREVVEYTPVVQEPDTFVTRISRGFSRNLNRVGNGIVDFTVWLISSLPQIVVIALVLCVLFAIRRRLKIRRAARIAAEGGEIAKKERRGLRGLFRKKNAGGAQAVETPAADDTPEEKG